MNAKHLMWGVILAALSALPSHAQQFPTRPIAIQAGFSAGGAQDVAVRIVADKMSEILGQQVYVENRPGDSTNIAAMYVRDAEPDGYTLFIAGHTNSVNPSLSENVPVDILNDFDPIGLVASVPNVLVVPPSLGVESVPELIELAKSTEGGLFYGSSGVGSVSHLSGEYLANLAKAPLVHVPYQGSSDAMNDLLAGQTNLMFAARSAVNAYVQEGRLLALAVTTAERLSDLPDLPTVAESGIEGFDASIWFGLVAPKGTPADVIGTLELAINSALDDKQVQERLAQQGVVPFKGDGEAFWAYMQAAMDRWAVIIEENNIQAQ